MQWHGRMAVGERKRGREEDMVEGTGRHGYVAIKKARRGGSGQSKHGGGLWGKGDMVELGRCTEGKEVWYCGKGDMWECKAAWCSGLLQRRHGGVDWKPWRCCKEGMEEWSVTKKAEWRVPWLRRHRGIGL